MHVLEIHTSLRLWPTKRQIKRSRKLKAPSEWGELTAKQAIGLQKAVHYSQDTYEYKCLITQAMLNFDWGQMLAFTPEQMVQLNNLFSFLHGEENGLLKNPMPYIRIGLRRYYCAPDDFADMSAAEWIHLDGLYRQIPDNPEMLYEFAATLYRPKWRKFTADTMVDKREPFRQYWGERFASKIKKHLGLYGCLVVKQWYEATRIEQDKTFWRVFTETAKSEAESYGWGEILMKMAGPAFGTLEEVERAPINTLLLKMQVDGKDFEQMEAQRKKYENKRSF